jgi:glycosyltransferase involved in cell wall biosynthesis
MVCGPSRDAVSGVSTHVNQIFGSSLAKTYCLVHFQVGSEGRPESTPQKIVRIVASPLTLLKEIVRFRPDVIHLNTSLVRNAYWRDLAYLLVARILHCKVVYQVHGGDLPSDFLGHNTLGRGFLRWSLAIPDVIVLLAESEREAYRSFATAKPLIVIPNAIDLAEYRAARPKSFEGSGIVLGYIGRLAAEKGVGEAIRAVAILQRSGFDGLRFRIAGSGPYERELRESVDREGLQEVVEFVGPVFGEAKARFWESIDLFVFPTAREGLPYTILEAMASATPVLTTRVGCIPDTIQEGVQGAFLSSRDPESIAGRLRAIVTDRERLRSMSSEALRCARDHYSVERLAAQFDELYRGLLA